MRDSGGRVAGRAHRRATVGGACGPAGKDEISRREEYLGPAPGFIPPHPTQRRRDRWVHSREVRTMYRWGLALVGLALLWTPEASAQRGRGRGRGDDQPDIKKLEAELQ